MTTWTARRLAWSVGIVSIALLLAALVLMFVDRGSDLPGNVGIWSAADVVDVLVNIGVPILGIVIVEQASEERDRLDLHRRGGRARARGAFGQAYALHVLVADPGTLPAGRALAWLSNVLWPIPIVCPHRAVPPVPDRTPPVTAMASRRLARRWPPRRC